ncbi:hypothetical protein AVEN_206817-1 [Araneus ventricosus]|uniref:Uncharacterized protein n=1 Tax=Araneus ventricosus TaxID=182803 RepID=A0A4Y2C6N3_ARAVE|nr:hypothetical protein AVEN_206817-1 [Araneus ventricosus]
MPTPRSDRYPRVSHVPSYVTEMSAMFRESFASHALFILECTAENICSVIVLYASSNFPTQFRKVLDEYGQRMYSVKKGHVHRRNVNQRPQRYLVPGEEYARQEKQLPDVSLMAIQASRSFS